MILTVNKKCWSCEDVHNLEVSQDGWEAWQSGGLIQDALPELSADDRELLISETCGVCWDQLFGVDEEDEEITDDDLIWEE